MAVVTISRQFGAGGLTLGKRVADSLDYTFIDNEIIQLISQKAKVSTDWVKSVEREAGGRLQKFISNLVPKNLVERVLDNHRGYIDEEIYVELLHQIVSQVANEGNAVILGRGSQYILKDRKNTYHILLVADRDDRVKFMQDHYRLDQAQAIQSVNSEDRRRTNLYLKFGKENYDSPSHYHLVLNMSRITLDAAQEMIVDLISTSEPIQNT